MERELTDEQIEAVKIAMIDSPVFVNDAMATYFIGSEIMFNNPCLYEITVNTFVTVSGGQLFYENSRKDGSVVDVDRRFIILDRNHASGAMVQTIPIKDFPEHHKPKDFHLRI